jgi:hypothetical protein
MDKVAVRPVYGLDEFCREFGIGRTLAYPEIAAGRLKAFKVGKRTLIAGEDGLSWRDMYRGRMPQPKRAA